MINSTPAISCSLAPAASATPGGPLPAGYQRAEDHRCPQSQRPHGLGIQGRYRGRAKPEPGQVPDEVSVCEHQPARDLLGCHQPTCLRPVHRQATIRPRTRATFNPSEGINLAAHLAGTSASCLAISSGNRTRHHGGSPHAGRAWPSPSGPLGRQRSPGSTVRRRGHPVFARQDHTVVEEGRTAGDKLPAGREIQVAKGAMLTVGAQDPATVTPGWD
jgi:hypothetical protein